MLSYQTAIQMIEVIIFTIITRITSSRDESSPPKITMRSLVMDLSISLEQQSSSVITWQKQLSHYLYFFSFPFLYWTYYYKDLIGIVQIVSYQIYNRNLFQSAFKGKKELHKLTLNKIILYLSGWQSYNNHSYHQIQAIITDS